MTGQGMPGGDDMMEKRPEKMGKRMGLMQKNMGMPQGAPEKPAK